MGLFGRKRPEEKTASDPASQSADPVSGKAEKEFQKGMDYVNDKNFVKGLSHLRSAAKKGHLEAQYQCASLYAHNGIGRCYDNDIKDYGDAVRWYLKAAQRGHVEAQYWLGWCYEEGYGTKKDVQKALYWYQKAGEAGNFGGLMSCGHIYKEKKDVQKALYWYQKAGESGNSAGLMACGSIYEDGKLVLPDKGKALEWYLKVAEQGDTDVQYRCAKMYFEGGEGLQPDLDKALYWAERAIAESDHFLSGYLRKDILKKMEEKAAMEEGESLFPDALKLYQAGKYAESYPAMEKAAKLGVAEAQYLCGVMLRDGMASDPSRSALDWFYDAGKQGHLEAMYSLARCHEEQKDSYRAFGSYRRAAEKGHKEAVRRVAEVEQVFDTACAHWNSTPDKRAFPWFEEAAELGHPAAIFLCGQWYLGYLGGDKVVPRNSDKALSYLSQLIYEGDYKGHKGKLPWNWNGQEMAEQSAKICAELYLKAGDRANAIRCYQRLSFSDVTEFRRREAAYLCGCLLYEDGQKQEAARSFGTAADAGSRKAQFRYGKMLVEGDGIEEDEKWGRQLIEKSGMRYVEEEPEVEMVRNKASRSTGGEDAAEAAAYAFPTYLYDSDENPWQLINSGYDNATYYCQKTGGTATFHKSDFDIGAPAGFHRR